MLPCQKGNMFRTRRLRKHQGIRRLVKETKLSVDDFVYPLFIEEGENIETEIVSMPGIKRWSLDTISKELDEVVELRMLTEGSESYGALPAADCLELVEQALLSGVNEDKKRAFDASQLSIATITQFIEFSEGEGLDENALVKLFDKHPLIEREFSFQSELNDLLRAATHPGVEVINELRELAQDEGLSNLGISLDD